MNFAQFEKDMAVFDIRQHQNFITYKKALEMRGYTVADVEEYLRELSHRVEREKAKHAEFLKSGVKCPVCDKPMTLLDVNKTPSTQTGDPSDKSCWFCRACGETIYNKDSVKQILKDIGGE